MSICFSAACGTQTAVASGDAKVGVCARLDSAFTIVTEFEGPRLKREMLSQAHCLGEVLTFFIEDRAILRLRLGNDNHVKLEGAIERVQNPIDGVLVEEEGKLLLKVSGQLKHSIQVEDSPAPLAQTEQFQLPIEKGRKKPYLESEIPSIGRYASGREGARLHTAIDVPADSGTAVLAPAPGQVVLVSHLKTQSTVFIKHLHGAKVYYSALAHLKEIKVHAGDQVNAMTELGRVMNKRELGRTHHAYNHVHLEVRKKISDLGNASIHANQEAALTGSFVNPSLPLEGEWSW